MPLDLIKEIYDKKIPFHRFLGIKVTEAADARGAVEFDYSPDLVGNLRLEALHGGVISAVLDISGSVAVLASFGPEKRLAGIGTVDLRTDYLRPARGRRFKAASHVVRSGRSIVVTRIDLTNEKDQLLAIGTASYRVAFRKTPPGGNDPDRNLTEWLSEELS